MAPEVMSALVDTGLLRMIPEKHRGLEMAPNAALAVMEALARIDAATGWWSATACSSPPSISSCQRR